MTWNRDSDRRAALQSPNRENSNESVGSSVCFERPLCCNGMNWLRVGLLQETLNSWTLGLTALNIVFDIKRVSLTYRQSYTLTNAVDQGSFPYPMTDSALALKKAPSMSVRLEPAVTKLYRDTKSFSVHVEERVS